MPGSSSAGSWYVRLFPVPVASTSRLGSPFMARSTPHSCPSRNDLCPNTRRSAVAGVSGRSGSSPPSPPSESAVFPPCFRPFLPSSTASSESESESESRSSELLLPLEPPFLLDAVAAPAVAPFRLWRPDAPPSASFRRLLRSALRRLDALEGTTTCKNTQEWEKKGSVDSVEATGVA